MLNDVRLILFDLDDTLIDFDNYWPDSIKETASLHPLVRDMDQRLFFESFCELDGIYEQLYLDQKITIQQFRQRRFIETMARFGIEVQVNDADSFDRMCTAVRKKFMKPNADVTHLIERLSTSYRLGIVTNGTLEQQLDKIEALGVHKYFPRETVFVSDDVGYDKPSPEIYRLVLDRFGEQPDKTLFVGDSWRNDVWGPGQLGLRTVWLNRKGVSVPDTHKPTCVIRHIRELIHLF